jgi:hypothetical protein
MIPGMQTIVQRFQPHQVMRHAPRAAPRQAITRPTIKRAAPKPAGNTLPIAAGMAALAAMMFM